MGIAVDSRGADRAGPLRPADRRRAGARPISNRPVTACTCSAHTQPSVRRASGRSSDPGRSWRSRCPGMPAAGSCGSPSVRGGYRRSSLADFRVGIDNQADYAQKGYRLARAGLADDTEDLPCVTSNSMSSTARMMPVFGAEGDLQVANRQHIAQRFRLEAAHPRVEHAQSTSTSPLASTTKNEAYITRLP